MNHVAQDDTSLTRHPHNLPQNPNTTAYKLENDRITQNDNMPKINFIVGKSFTNNSN